MTPEAMKQRTKTFALEVFELVAKLPQYGAGRVIGNQLLRSASSVGANYRAALRAKSTADFISKMGTVEEEADESVYWLELVAESGLREDGTVARLKDDASQLTAIVVSSIRTAKAHRAPKSA